MYEIIKEEIEWKILHPEEKEKFQQVVAPGL